MVERLVRPFTSTNTNMGYIRNHAIIVTATYGDFIQRAHDKARDIFGENISEITPEVVNGSRSFLVPPDGSKEGWEESDVGDNRRELFKDWLRAQAYEDHSTPLHWVELRYGGNDREAVIEEDCHAALRLANAKLTNGGQSND